jgi:hypothetical protein
MTSAAPFLHFQNQTATNTGAVLDLDTGLASGTCQVTASTGTTAGAVTVLGSVDGVNYVPLNNAILTGKLGAGTTLSAGIVSFTGPGSALVSFSNAGGAVRFLRADVTTTMVGGTATAWSLGR